MLIDIANEGRLSGAKCMDCLLPNKKAQCSSNFINNRSGFTLIEIIIVLALIGLIATFILPALRRSIKSEMMDGIHNISSQIKLTYDDTIFTGRVHRMIFDIKNGTFWTEIAPEKFKGRAPVLTEESKNQNIEKIKYFDRFNDEANSAKILEQPILEIPVEQRAVLGNSGSLCNNQKNCWRSSSNKLISSKQFAGNLVFVRITTGLSETPLIFTSNLKSSPTESKAPEEKNLAYIYFFPDGSTTPASFQLGFRDENWNIDTNALKYTLNLNIFTGQLKLLQGFQEANFELPK